MVASLAWGGLSNGYIPESLLTPIGRGFLLEANAARQFLAAAAELRRDHGISLIDYVSETYRDFAGQVYQRQRWTALGKPNNAAIPGGSVHGWAKAVDFNADALMADGVYDIVMAVLLKYGFIRDVDGESWHVSFREAQITLWASADITPISTDWLDMATEEETRTAMHDGVKAALEEVLPGALAALPKPNRNLQIVFGAQFASGDTNVNGIGQATAATSPAGSDWGNFYLIDWDDYSYTWVVTEGQIHKLISLYGNGQGGYDRVDAAFFIGMKNGFSRDAVELRPGQ